MAQVLKFRRLLLQSPRIVKDCIILLIFGHLLTFVAAFINMTYPKWSGELVNWFWCPDFDLKIARYWYFKNSGELILNIITYYLLAKVAKTFSDVLFVIFFVFFGYHIVDFIMFWWDSNNQFYMYIDLFYTIIVLVSYAIPGTSMKALAKVKSFF